MTTLVEIATLTLFARNDRLKEIMKEGILRANTLRMTTLVGIVTLPSEAHNDKLKEMTKGGDSSG